MTRKAQITLGMDIRPLKEQSRAAKEALESIGKVPLDKEIKKAFKKEIFQDATRQADLFKNAIQDSTRELGNMASSGSKAWDNGKAQLLLRSIREYRNQLQEVTKLQRSMRFPTSMGGGGMGMSGGGARGGGGGGPMGMMRGMGGGMLGGLGISLGVGMAMSRSMGQADQSLNLRALSGGTLTDRSRMGFTRDERRGRAVDVSRGMGRTTSTGELTRATNMSETMERAFGIGSGQVGDAVGAARKAGVKDQTKFVADTVGDAVNAGLTGGAVGEYLQSMTGYLSEMSQNVNIDDSSVRGIASALGELDFFKNSPQRIFDAMRSIGQMFSQGNQYQQALSFQSMTESGGTGNVAGFMNRQGQGLFSGGKGPEGKGTALSQKYRALGMEGVAQDMEVEGKDIADRILVNAFNQAKDQGRNDQNALQIFRENTSMITGDTGPEIFAELEGQRQRTGNARGITGGQFKEIKKGMRGPEEIAADAMESFDGSVKRFGERISNMKDVISDNFTGAVMTFDKAITEFTGIKNDFVKLGLIIAAATVAKSFGGGGGAGGPMGGKLGKGAGLAAAAIIGIPAAKELGTWIGQSMRDVLNEWTQGEWTRFWNDLLPGFMGGGTMEGAEKGAGIAKYATKLSEASEKAGIRLSPVEVQRQAGELGIEEARLKEEGYSGTALEKRMARKFERRVEKNTDVIAAKERLQKSQREGTTFDPETEAGEEMKEFIDRASPTTWQEDYEEEYGGITGMQFGGIARMQKGGRSKAQKILDPHGQFTRKPKPKPKPKDDGPAWWDQSWEARKERMKRQAAKGKQFGGPIEPVKAMLTPGEFVVNAESSSKNFNALVHANNGGLIQGIGDSSPASAEPDFASMMGGMGGMGDATDPENTSATSANTQALMALAQAISSMSRGGGGGFPRGSEARLG